MYPTLKLLDSIPLHNIINTNNALIVSEDDRYCIIAEDGLYILHLSGLMDNILSTVSFKKSFIRPPEYIPSSNVDIDINNFVGNLPQNDLYESILTLNLSENLQNSVGLKQQPVWAQWSPLGLIHNAHCALAVLMSTGSLMIFVDTVNDAEMEEFIPIANITQMCIDHFKPTWGTPTKQFVHTYFNELKKRIDQALPTALAWSKLIILEDEKFCILIVGHLNGGISLWKVKSRLSNDIAESEGISFMAYYKTGLERISALHFQHSHTKGLLLAGDIKGRVIAISITKISKKSVKFGDQAYLWNEKDKIKVERITLHIYKNLIYVLIIKGSFLLVCLINERGELIDICNFNAGNFRIIDTVNLQDNLFLLIMCTGALKELKILYENHKIHINWRPIDIDFKSSLYRVHGLAVSPNRVLFSVLSGSICLTKKKEFKQPIQLFVYTDTKRNPSHILMNNNHTSLIKHWDCLETLRLSSLIGKRLPSDEIFTTNPNYDTLSLVHLKTCLWLAKSSEVVSSKLPTVNVTLCYEKLRCIVKIKMAVEHVTHLLNILTNDGPLEDFHMQSLDILNAYLKQIVLDDIIPQLGLTKRTIDALFNVISMANKLCYPPQPICTWCNKYITGLSCVPPHVDNRCNISFMPILSLPYYKCAFCECVVHHKLSEVYDTVMCPYCDIPLDFVSFLKGSNNYLNSCTTTNVNISETKHNSIHETSDELLQTEDTI